MTTRPRRGGPNFDYQPGWGDPCPCGSGRRFQACCRSRLPSFKKIDKAWRDAASAGNWEGALLLVRADVAQYVIWHRRHTIPDLKIPGRPQAEMFRIDVAALSEHVGNLVQVLYRLGRLNQAPAVLERLRPAIADAGPRFSAGPQSIASIERADRALYAAKTSGRNQTMVWNAVLTYGRTPSGLTHGGPRSC